ncbi:MAG: histidine--tRNA ligase [Candidatus Omnitrophica bacterium]|nr:histidine--tRNA ligase [Candidatus Omnitrophota bacterium]
MSPTTTIQALRGTADILPGESVQWQTLEAASRALFARYHYQEIRTPLLEEVSLFQRTVGETTDIVQKEMYVFEDRGGRAIALRPEATASVVRAYLEHHLDKTAPFSKLYYLGAMFRAERPQAGRLRQFHQVGVEALGTESAFVDAEVIALLDHLLREWGITGHRIGVATLGCRKDKDASAAALRKRLTPLTQQLCDDCRQRLSRNVFRVLDCKVDRCRALAWEGGAVLTVCAECRRHFDTVKTLLKRSGVGYDDTQQFVRGLDYYTRTVFEVAHDALGAKDVLGAGGRYDHLIEELGGPHLGAVGFAIGIERSLMARQHHQAAAAPPASRGFAKRAGRAGGVFVVTIGEASQQPGWDLVARLRRDGVVAEWDPESKSLKSQMRTADRLGFRHVALLGAAELQDHAVTLKDLGTGSQERIPVDRLAARLNTAVVG